MGLRQSTQFILITWVLLIIVCQTMCESRSILVVTGSSNQNFALDIPALYTVYCSHRVLFLTCLSTLSITLLGCLGCLCCNCCRSAQKKGENLDAYAPRTQSIVWPTLPETTAYVVEMTFLHAPGSLDCLCRTCELTRNMQCIENCLSATEC